MIDRTRLRDLLAKRDYTRNEKLFMCLATAPDHPMAVKDIKMEALDSGLTEVRKWNISAILSSSRGLVVRAPAGWQLTTDGQRRVVDLVGPLVASPVAPVASSLRSHLPKLKDLDSKNFLEEAIECFEQGQFRAAVVLTWVGAVSVLHKFVFASHLTAFNTEATRRDAKWKIAKNTDDLGRMKEADFLTVLEAISVIGKNVKQELEGCLKLRNSCGHPNSLKIGESRVSAHVEVLLLNVFQKFCS